MEGDILCCHNGKKFDDDVEGKPFPSFRKSSIPSLSSPVPISPVEKDSEFYNMKHKRRGLALVFCQTDFDKKLKYKKRQGCEADLRHLRRMFSELRFEDPIVCMNFTRAQIRSKLLEVQAMDFRDSDCLMITILTHGERGNILMARDDDYSFEEVWGMFTADLCPSLAQKPKIFFIQACKGSKVDSGQTLLLKSFLQTDSIDAQEATYTIPTHADFLFFYSTVENFVSFQNDKYGSWFIKVLCDVISTQYKEKDLLKMATVVCRRVGIEYSSHSIGHYDNKKECPSILSTLTHDLKFY